MSWTVRVLAAAAMIAAANVSARAEYPEKTVRIVVPFAPGGGTTTMARLVSDELKSRLGADVVIENREGAGGTVGSTSVARSAPDGYTLLLAHSGTVAIAPHIYSKLQYDALKDFTPVGLIAEVPLALVVPASLPVSSVAELVELAKREPGTLSYASGGIGTGGHLAAAHFAAVTGIDIKHVPYRGSGPTIPDLLAGRVDLSLGPIVPFLPHIEAGTLKALAVTSAERSALAPGVATMKELGFDFETALLYGIVAPSGTPRDVLERLNTEMREIVAQPKTIELVAQEGGTPVPVTLEEYKALMEADHAKWGEAVKAANVRPIDQ